MIHVHFGQVEHADGVGLRFGQVVGNFRERFGRADADGDRDAGVAPHRRPYQTGILCQTAALEPGQVEKGLVDAVELDFRGKGAQRVHDAAAHVAVQRIVGAEHGDAVTGQFLAVEVVGIAHREAEGFGLIAAGDEAAVVVRQHDDRSAFQGRLKDPLTADVKIVRVSQGEDGRGHRAT